VREISNVGEMSEIISVREPFERRELAQRILSWTLIPAILVLTVALLYVFVIARVEPGSMSSRVITPDLLTGMAWEHLKLVLISSGLAIITAIPAGILITRSAFRDLAGVFMSIANIGQTVPSIAILGLSMTYLGIGFQPAVFALWIYALLPILRNTYTGIMEVDPAVIDAARGMGMTDRQILWRIELPLALSVIFAGIRISVVINVGTAALATFIGVRNLGLPIAAGLRVRRDMMVLAGGVLTAVFAIAMDFILGKIEARLVPPSN
jgi:osmoprotectant transport system permease protein